jgi:hypothetical protein
MSDEMQEKSFKEKVIERISRPTRKVLITFPVDVLEKLDDYSKDNSGHCYWLSIQSLLEYYFKNEEQDLRTALLMERDDKIMEEVNNLLIRINRLEKEPVKEERKHFGKK